MILEKCHARILKFNTRDLALREKNQVNHNNIAFISSTLPLFIE